LKNKNYLESSYAVLLLQKLERPKRRWEDGSKMDLRDNGLGVWSGFIWLRIRIFGGLL
jgi:hypothetical protein